MVIKKYTCVLEMRLFRMPECTVLDFKRTVASYVVATTHRTAIGVVGTQSSSSVVMPTLGAVARAASHVQQKITAHRSLEQGMKGVPGPLETERPWRHDVIMYLRSFVNETCGFFGFPRDHQPISHTLYCIIMYNYTCTCTACTV